MPIDVSAFLGFAEGDLVTLSDIQTQKQYNELSVDFRIRGIRKYHEPNDCFTFTCYLLEGPEEEEQLMLMVVQIGKVFDLFVYFLDTEGEVYSAQDGQEECPFLDLFQPDADDLKERIEAVVTSDAGKEREVTWDKQNSSTFGVEYSDGEGDECIVTVAEYFTEDENDGNDRCFVDWKGSKKKGYIEAWYGAQVESSEVEILPTGK